MKNARKIIELFLDDKPSVIQDYNFTEDDFSKCEIEFVFYENSSTRVPYVIDKSIMSVVYQNPNGSWGNDKLEIIDSNRALVTLSGWAIDNSGTVKAMVQGYDTDGRLSFGDFKFKVKKDFGPMQLEETDKFSLLTKLISETSTIISDEKQRISNEVARISNEKLRQESENYRNKDYESLKKIIIDENQAANLQDQINEVNSQLDDLANKGTTVEVLERVTKEEIDRQIQDGTIANLTIADNSITNEKIGFNAIDMPKIDYERITNIKSDNFIFNKNTTNDHLIYLFENTNVENNIKDIKVEMMVDIPSEIKEIRLKLYSNDSSGVNDISGGQIINTPYIECVNFSRHVITLNNVDMKYKYYRILIEFITATPIITMSSKINVLDNNFTFTDKCNLYMDKSPNIKCNFDERNLKSLINYENYYNETTVLTKSVVESETNEIEKRVKSITNNNTYDLDISNAEYNNRQYPNIICNDNFRNELEDRNIIPAGTTFSYDLCIETFEGGVTSIGLQLFNSRTINDGTFIKKYKTFPHMNVSTIANEKLFFNYSVVLDSDININDIIHLKYYFDVNFVNFKGNLKYENIRFLLPNGEQILKKEHITACYFGYAEKTELTYNQKHLVNEGRLNKESHLINETIKNNTEHLIELITNAKFTPSRWTGKRYYSCGDSITWQDGASGYLPNGELLKGYQYYVNEKHSFSEYTNYGHSGMTVANIQANSFVEKCKTINWMNTDLCTIALCTNDFAADVPIGEIDSFNVNTIYGAYNWILQYIFPRNPNIRIVLMTPFQRTVEVNSNGGKLIDYVNAIKNIGQKWSCPVFDSYSNGGWGEGRFNIYTVDGLHGSNEGFKIAGERLAEFINGV